MNTTEGDNNSAGAFQAYDNFDKPSLDNLSQYSNKYNTFKEGNK